MHFLAKLYHEDNYNLGVIAVALPFILPRNNGVTFGQDPTVLQMIKQIFKLRPTLPKYTLAYDPDVMLAYISTLPSNPMLSLELIMMKLAILLWLSSEH